MVGVSAGRLFALWPVKEIDVANLLCIIEIPWLACRPVDCLRSGRYGFVLWPVKKINVANGWRVGR
jgi:hypothetical protein